MVVEDVGIHRAEIFCRLATGFDYRLERHPADRARPRRRPSYFGMHRAGISRRAPMRRLPVFGRWMMQRRGWCFGRLRLEIFCWVRSERLEAAVAAKIVGLTGVVVTPC